MFGRRSLVVVMALTMCARSDVPAPRKPPADSRVAAIGLRPDMPRALARALDPSHFTPLGKPGPLDWLASHSEAGETFQQYGKSWPNRPDRQRHVIYLQPLGTFGAEAPPVELLQKYAAAFFMMEVKVLPTLPVDPNITSRPNGYGGGRQLRTGDILSRLGALLPSDGFCLLAITMEDLYPGSGWNFVFGQASLTERVGVYSFARYGGGSKELLLRRSFKVLTHETGHMFGISHCIWYECVMNGSNHLAETDARPMHLCPVDLHKLKWNIGFDVVARDRRLRDVCREAHLDDEVQWLDAELARME
jgi:archaemetzincin